MKPTKAVETNDYKCKHCGSIVARESNKQWIKSFCGITGQDTHIHKIKLSQEERKKC